MTKTIFCLVVTGALGLSILGCQDSSKPTSASNEEETNATAENQDEKKVFHVSSASEFIDAIGPDRVIQLAEGTYYLCSVPDRYHEYVRWDKVHDGRSITIRNVQGLTIRGEEGKPATLLVKPQYAFVLNFESCENVKMQDLILGHAPEKGYCDSGVVGLNKCKQISLLRCDMFGCGTEGLTIRSVDGLTVTDSIIRECTYGIMTINGSKNLTFRKNTFKDNVDIFYGITLSDSKNVQFDECAFSGNQLQIGDYNKGLCFDASSCSDIVVRNASFSKNRYGLLQEGTAVKFVGTVPPPGISSKQNK